MLGALERSFPAEASWSRPDGGYFLWLELGEGRDASELAARAEAEGVGLVRGEDFFPPGSGLGRSSARLAFSYETPERIVEGIERLATLAVGAYERVERAALAPVAQALEEVAAGEADHEAEQDERRAARSPP